MHGILDHNNEGTLWIIELCNVNICGIDWEIITLFLHVQLDLQVNTFQYWYLHGYPWCLPMKSTPVKSML